MATSYRIQCQSCGRFPESNGGVAGYVAMDDREGGSILPEGSVAVRNDNGVFVCLPHPIEDSVLQEQGFTWTEASRAGRLFYVTYKICRRCGTLHEESQIHDTRGGCVSSIVSIILGILTTVLLKFSVKWSWGAALLTGYVTLMVLLALASLLNRFRWRKENNHLKLRECVRCGSNEFITFSKAGGKSLICPYCKTPNLRCETAGIS